MTERMAGEEQVLGWEDIRSSASKMPCKYPSVSTEQADGAMVLGFIEMLGLGMSELYQERVMPWRPNKECPKRGN